MGGNIRRKKDLSGIKRGKNAVSCLCGTELCAAGGGQTEFARPPLLKGCLPQKEKGNGTSELFSSSKVLFFTSTTLPLLLLLRRVLCIH